jgi:hypothetical protein
MFLNLCIKLGGFSLPETCNLSFLLLPIKMKPKERRNVRGVLQLDKFGTNVETGRQPVNHSGICLQKRAILKIQEFRLK